MKVAIFTNTVERGAFSASFSGISWALTENGVTDIDILYYNGDAKKSVNVFPYNVRFIKLDGGRGIKSILGLRRYLEQDSPDFLITGPNYVNLIAIFTYITTRWKKHGKLIITHHHPIELSHQISKKNNKWLSKFFYKYASASYGVSPSSVDDAIKMTNINPKTVELIPNVLVPYDGSDSNETHPWLSDKKKSFIFITVSRLVPSKNIGLLIKAFSSVSAVVDSKLIIVGQGPDMENLKKLIKSLSLEKKVCLCGFIEDVKLYINQANAFVLSSNEEGFGQVITEAMSVGCPIISTDASGGGVRYILQDGKYGVLVPKEDEIKLGEAMIEFATQKSVVQRYKELAQLRAKDFYPKVVGQKLIKFLSGI